MTSPPAIQHGRSGCRFTRHAVLLAGGLGLVLASPAGARQDHPVFTARADLVVLHVTVTDRRGRPVTGLPREAFAVSEDGRRQEVQFFAHDDAPVAVGLLVDSSGSMAASRDRVIAATSAFARTAQREDAFFGLSFNDGVTAALPPQAPFTSRVDVLADALAGSVAARGRTSLFDAIAAGLDYTARSAHPRRVLVVVSDGGDNASRTTFDQVVQRVQQSNTAIYTIALTDPLERDADPGMLQRLADDTGGRAFKPRSVERIDEAFRQIGEEIRHAYTLGYVSTNDRRDGTYRRTVVSLEPTRHRQPVTVRTRRGYRAQVGRDGYGHAEPR